MKNKQIIFNVELARPTKVKQGIPPTVFTNDTNIVEFIFNVTDLEVPETATAEVNIFMRDGSFFQKDALVEGSEIRYTLSDTEGKHAGLAQIQMTLSYENKRYSTNIFQFKIDSGLNDKVAVEVLIQDWDTITTEARQYLEQLADYRTEFSEVIADAQTQVNANVVEGAVEDKFNALEAEYAQDITSLKQSDISLTAQLAQTEKKRGVYKIELDKFDITPGLLEHKAPYSQKEYEKAYNNFNGIQNALNYASNQGYSEVVLPKNDYIVCYQDPIGQDTHATWNNGWEIIIPSNMVVDLGGSCISVIFDSDNRNPYDLGSLPTWNLAGRIFGFSETYHSTIQNGELKGDRYERSYNNPNEPIAEQTYGVFISAGSRFNSILNMKIHGFMGDSVSSTLSSDSKHGAATPWETKKFYPNYIDVNGNEMVLEGSYSSDFYDVSSLDSKEIVISPVAGRKPLIKNQNVLVSFYDSTKSFIGQQKTTSLKPILKPKGTMFTKVSISGEEKGLDSLDINIRFSPPQPSNLTIRGCEFFNNNRGGISNVVNDTIISHNRIYSNGAGEKEGWPLFPDSTKYAINIEDTNMENVRISDNYIYDGANAILISGARNSLIENNYIMNFNRDAVSIYGPVESMHFNNNKIYDTNGIIGTVYDISYGKRYIYANNNIGINSGNMIVKGGSTFIGSGNVINNRYFNADIEKGVIDNLIFDEEPNLFNQLIKNNELKGVFTNAQINLSETQLSTATTKIDVKEGSRNVKLNIEDDNKRIEPYDNSEIHGLIMNGGRVYKIIGNKDVELKFINCTFTDLFDFNFEAWGNKESQRYRVSFEDCKFNISGKSREFFKVNVTGSKSDFVFDFLDCDIIVNSTNNNELFIFMVYSGKGIDMEVNLTDVRINTEKAEGETELLLNRFDSSEANHIVNVKNLDVTGLLTKSQEGYVINNL